MVNTLELLSNYAIPALIGGVVGGYVTSKIKLDSRSYNRKFAKLEDSIDDFKESMIIKHRSLSRTVKRALEIDATGRGPDYESEDIKLALEIKDAAAEFGIQSIDDINKAADALGLKRKGTGQPEIEGY